MSEFVERLTGAPRRLKAEKGVPVQYQKLRIMAIDDLFPAHQINGIWHYNISDLDLIAAAIKRQNRSASLQAA